MIKNKRRFIFSDIWSDEWFGELEDKYKLFWVYLITNCDHSGVWRLNVREVNYCISHKMDLDEAEKVFLDKILVLDKKRWFINNFFKHQYGKRLNLSNSAIYSALKQMIIEGVEERTLVELGHEFLYSDKVDGKKTTYQLVTITSHFMHDTPLVDLRVTEGTDEGNLRKDKEKEKIKVKSKEKEESKGKGKYSTITVNQESRVENDSIDQLTEGEEKELEKLKSINLSEDYPTLGTLKEQLNEEQMKLLVKDSSAAQLKEVMQKICDNKKEFLSRSVYESIINIVNQQELPF